MEKKANFQKPTMGVFFLGAALYLTGTSIVIGWLLMGAAFIFAFGFALYTRKALTVKGYIFGVLLSLAFAVPLIGQFMKEEDPNALTNRAKYAATICPVWFKQNTFGRYVTYRDDAWCAAYESYVPKVAEASKIDMNATASTTPVSAAPLWK